MKIEHHLPIIWTYFDFMETDQGVYQSVRFANMSILYDKNWTFRVPHFMLNTPISELTAELSNISALSMENWYHYPYSKVIENPHLSFMTIWCFILTLWTIYLHTMYKHNIRVFLQKLPQLSDTHFSQVLNKLEKFFFYGFIKYHLAPYFI